MEDCPTCGLNAAVSAGSLYDEEDLMTANLTWAGRNLYDGRNFLDQFDALRNRFVDLEYNMSKWKVLTISGGGHPFMSVHDDVLEKIEENLNELLTKASSIAPVYINILESWTDIHQNHLYCKLFTKVLITVQSGSSFDYIARRFQSLSMSYNKLLAMMQYRYDNPERGVVVRVQPALKHMIASKETLDKISCYHPSRRQHSLMARTLLQNMVECDGAKKWDRPSLADSSLNVLPETREVC